MLDEIIATVLTIIQYLDSKINYFKSYIFLVLINIADIKISPIVYEALNTICYRFPFCMPMSMNGRYCWRTERQVGKKMTVPVSSLQDNRCFFMCSQIESQ